MGSGRRRTRTSPIGSPAGLGLPDLGTPTITPAIRAYLAKKHFAGRESPEIEEAVEILIPPDCLIESIVETSWVRRQLSTFVPGKVYLLVKTPEGKTRALHFRGERCRSDKELTPARERVLRRLYTPALHETEPAPVLARWQERADLDPANVLEASIALVEGTEAYTLDEETLERARENFAASSRDGHELGVALGALAETEHGPECVWAGLWLVSRMDRMAFRRQAAEKSLPDLTTITGRLFFENVYYAVKARHLFPWGPDVEVKDFLHHVLSPRGTGEPLQGWRRPFFEALEPEVRAFGTDERKAAMQFATACCYDFYQYEGDTTWEDFGMLTSLAVHEGRCEDCSNVQNCFVRAIGLPACQAFTPWWGHANGNHAWTVVPSLDGAKTRDGPKAVKVYVKHGTVSRT